MQLNACIPHTPLRDADRQTTQTTLISSFAAVFVDMRNRISIFNTLSSILAQFSAASSSGIGDYIAAGLRKDASSTTIRPSNSVLTSTSFTAYRNTTNSSDHAASISSTPSSSRTSNSPYSIETALSTSSFTPAISANTSMLDSTSVQILTTSNSSIHHFMNLAVPSLGAHNLTHSNSSRNASLDDSCWNSWSSHWSLLDPIKTTYVTTAVSTDIQPVTSHSSTAFWYVTVVQLTTITEFDGAHAIATSAFTDTETYSFPSKTTLAINTVTETITTSVSAPTKGITQPPCALPSFVPECQSSWDSYESWNWQLASGLVMPECVPRTIGTIQPNQTCVGTWLKYWWDEGMSKSSVGPAPSCTQATITGEYCSKEISRFLLSNSLARISRTLAGWTVTTMSDNSTATVWQSDRSFAPGCTMGCQKCRITGSSVELFWWPPQTAADDGLPVTAVGFGTTFTSPTVYISFNTLFASDSCSGVGKTYSSTILAIPNSKDISSLWGMSLVNGLQSTAAFNYTDLLHTDPVPTSIFNRQPRCVSSWWWQSTLAGPIDEYDCNRDYPWRPILALPRQVQDIDPEWANCVGGIEGVYDPPVALTSARSAIKPTLPHGISSTTEPAAPKSTHEPLPVQTHTSHFTFDPITTPDLPKQKLAPSTSPQDGHAKSTPTAQPPAQSPEQLPQESPTAAPQDPGAPQSDHHSGDSSHAADPPSVPKPVSKAVISVGGVQVTAIVQQSSGPIEIAQHTLTHGEVATIHDQVVSVGISGIVVNGQTAAFDRVAAQPTESEADPKPFMDINAVLHLGSESITARPLPTGGIEIGGQALTPGGAVTVDGHTISAGLRGFIIDGGSTLAFNAPHTAGDDFPRPEAKVTLGSEVITAAPLPSGEVLVNGHTRSLWQVTNIGGHNITAVRNGIAVDGKTAKFSEAQYGRQKASSTAKAQSTHRANRTSSTSSVVKQSSTSSLDAAAAAPTNSNASNRILTGSGAGWLLAILAITLVVYA
ncbi:hypothetical protein AC578_10099 [Pseudocercospora eumusae]|uniref:Uncharacterized protein n=1 Tax=Pseudocercospora eumusae TaxID=321146 RepID=A0A139GVR5_9PEZI|nr:hypothetical protein AC578_10099 [Pseudocercospora eumusae]